MKGRKFELQYSQLYAVRLMAMKKKLAVAARKKWGKVYTALICSQSIISSNFISFNIFKYF